MRIGVDAAGNSYDLASNGIIELDPGPIHRGFLLERLNKAGSSEIIARLFTQVFLGGNATLTIQYGTGQFQFDAVNGRILIPVYLRPDGIASCPLTRYGLIEISGLPQMFDTLLTFVPSGQSLTALTPGLPDGFRSADSLQVWAGDVATLPDWSQATPMACPASVSPAPGQLVNATDTLPDPATGRARYYVVAGQNGTHRRLGRQYINGIFSARNPALLPVCAP